MMARINEQGYIERKSLGSGKSKGGCLRAVWRNWWLVKYDSNSKVKKGTIPKISQITLPKKYIGKRVRLKVEIIENKIDKAFEDVMK